MADMTLESSCAVCQGPGKQSCSSCHSSFYCSKDCQKKDWKNHKIFCIPYTVQVHPVYGRYTVASRDIAAGEIVLRDTPIIIGPLQNSTKLLCLGCHGPINGTHTCSVCKVPLCSAACEQSVCHETECPIFCKSKAVPRNNCILPLRFLLTKFTDVRKWKILNTLQDSLDLLNDQQKKRIEVNVIDYFRKLFNLREIDSDEIYQICGILNTNTFGFTPNGVTIEGVFPKAAMMAHNCVPNTENVFNGFQLIVRATVPIKKGDAINTTYIKLFWSTLQRRRHLLETKFFGCICERCSDPYELGSNLSTLICNQCQKGNVISSSPLEFEAPWKCQNCDFNILGKDVERMQDRIYKAFVNRDRTLLQFLEDLIDQWKNRLHPKHQIIMQAKCAWVQFVGNHPQYKYKNLSESSLKKKIIYCRDLLESADIIFPGQRQFRGIFLYELHAALVALANYLNTRDNEARDKTVKEYIHEAKRCLEESKTIFQFEYEMKANGLNEKLMQLQKDFTLVC